MPVNLRCRKSRREYSPQRRIDANDTQNLASERRVRRFRYVGPRNATTRVIFDAIESYRCAVVDFILRISIAGATVLNFHDERLPNHQKPISVARRDQDSHIP